MKTSSKKHLRRTILCAIFAGALAAPFAAQTAYALPIEGANAATNAGEANISTSGTVMDITGKTEHNVLRWEDFSVDSGEKVRFDGGSQTRDYLNLVTGEGASNIYGTIEGGRNVYLVNPHGILFAKGSEVNTGALYLSTANPADIAAATNTFKADGTSPLSATAQTGDVLNLGAVKAAKLYIEGNNVTVLNTDAVKDANGAALTGANVTIRSAETPHIGYDVGHKTTENIDVNGAATPYQVFDYASTNADHHKASASARGWDVANLGGTAHTDYDYMRVHTVYDLQNINAKRDGRYILAGDIDATATTHWNSGEGFAPLGNGDNVFTGRFDGVGHTITALHIRWDKHYIGLFGYAGGARIENLSLKNAHVEGATHTGGIVGYAKDTVIRNVSYAGSVVGNLNVGGIAGDVSGGSIQNAWNAGTVSGRSQFLAGGIVGRAIYNAVIQNVCNTGAITGRMYIGGIVGGTGYNCTIQNAWNTGAVTGSELVGGIVGGMQNDCIVQNVWNTGTVTGNQKVGGIVGEADGGSIRHAVWKSGSAGQAVGALSNGADATTDVKFAAEADMKLAATYTDWKDANGNALVATDGGVGTPWRIYEGKTMPLLTGLMKGTKRLAKVYDGNVFATTDPHITLVHPGKDVGTYDAYSDQFGYDLIGGATIKPKSLTLGFTNGTRFDKTYDGSDTVTRTLTKGTNYSLTGFVGSEGADVELAGAVTGKYADKNAGRDKEVTFQNLALTGTGAGNYTITRARGVGTIAPKQLNLALANGARFDKTYDGNANVAQTLAKGTNYSLTGFIGTEGDHLALASATGTYTAGKDAAVNKGVTFDGLTLTGTGAANYVLDKTTLTGIGTISPKQLNLALTSGARFDKTYDGTANVTQTLTKGMNYSLTGFIGTEGDHLALASATGTYTDKNAGTGKAVNFTGLTLTGAGAGNYSLSTTTLTTTGDIAKRALTLEGTAGTQFTKTYDGNATVTQNLARGTNYRLAGVVEGEGTNVVALNESAAQGAYTTANAQAAGAQQNVTFTNLALTGSGTGNYTLATSKTFENAGRITPKELNLALASGTRFDKTYDGDANVAQTLAKGTNYSLTGFVTGEGTGIELSAVTGTYADKNAARDKAVTFGGLTLTGTGAANYVLNKTTLTGIGTITPRALTLGEVTAQSKTYDGTTAADTSKFGAVLNNVVAGEENLVKATASGAAYNSKDVVTAGTVGYTGVALEGTGAGNYSLAATTAEGAGTITRRTLTVNILTAQSKTYDGTTAADASQFRATLNNVVAGEENLVAATAAGAAYNDKNVAAANAVSYTGVALTGTGAANYAIADTAQGTGTITRRALTLGTVAAQSKTYDGTTAADASKFRATFANAVEGDNVTAAATGALYNDKNVAAANRIDYTGVALRGADAGNYSIVSTAQGAGTITHRELTLTAAPHSIVQGEALPSFTGRADGFADGEDASVFGPGGISFGTSAANTNTPGGYGIIGRVGGVSDGVFGNYRIGQAAGNATAFTIHAALPGGLLASLVQDAAPRFDMGFGQEVYVFGLPRPIPTATLGIYRFDAERAFEIQGLRL